ncbi:hypothetical protein [Actinomycetospora cinnamomea]|uniref:Uncharacterized protein n=1 Tax=Actinomycetospora cinnamomea TaxID=663609 RepID=A0A2U1FL05_9PSEU|nr:hypothetical protein [Actinomycetospora cinnamomea]PVZ12895.1 hypothetical protein C8D89_10243 [Actinomycetospora cinnamomea]
MGGVLGGTTAVVTGALDGPALSMVTRPRRAAVNEMLVRPTEQVR